jgi:formylmethanofuran dehydrogenase subunit E
MGFISRLVRVQFRCRLCGEWALRKKDERRTVCEKCERRS